MSRGPLLKQDIIRMAMSLDDVEKKMVPSLRQMLDLPKDKFNEHYYLETLWDAADLLALSGNDWIEMIDDVVGTNQIYTISRPRFMFFGVQWISPVGSYNVR